MSPWERRRPAGLVFGRKDEEPAGRWRSQGKLLATVSLLASLALACGDRPAEAPAESIVLAPGAVFPRRLAGTGTHRFAFAAEAGRLLRLDVEQRGVDVVVVLRDPAGGLLYEIDSPTRGTGRETVLAVTPVSGRYLLEVEPFRPDAKGGFALQVREVRPASARDRTCAATAAAWARAERRRLEGDFERAAAAYRQALPGLAACGEPQRRPKALWHLGEALLETGELRKAAAMLESAAAGFRRLGDGVGEARASLHLGAAWRLLGDPARALAAYRRALHLYQKAGIAQGEVSAVNNIGLVFEHTGDLQGAIDQYETALALCRRLGEKSFEAAILENLGRLYSLIGHDDQALDLLQQALDLAGQEDESRRLSPLIALGWAQHLAGRSAEAVDRYQEAMALAERSGNRRVRASILDRRGSALRALRRHGEAAESYAQALAASRETGSRISQGHTLVNLGWLDLETGAVARGRKRLRQARELLAASGDPNGQVYALVGLSRAERRLGDLGAARENAEAAIRLVEELRTGLRGSLSRGHFLATRFNAYEELVSLLMELDRREPAAGHARAALEVAERARARNLAEEMAGSPEETRSDGEGSRRKESLLAEIGAMEERRRMLAAGNPRDPRLRGLDAALRSRGLEVDRLTAVPARRPAFASLAEIQGLADADTLLAVYLLAEPASFAWTVDRDTVVSHLLPGRERIEQLARRVVAALPRSHEVAAQETAARVASELSEAILAPLGNRLQGRRRLVVLADGALNLIPFGALPAPPEQPGVMAEPLLIHHEIAMLPSATVLLSQRRRLAGRPPAPGTVAVLADPVFSQADERLARRAKAAGSGWAGERFDLEPLKRLPYTAEEARAIARLVPRKEALLAVGPAATRDLVTSGALRRYRIVHFATHGLLHPVLPERSGVVLSLFDEKGQRREGFLSAPDVAALDLPAELAVLSACDTALGREMRGEGLVGLTQAFFRAGVRGVVVGYWNVDDRATAALMSRFYRNLLAEGLPPAAALRAAQLAIRKQEKWRFPYYWAGFALHGDWRQGGSNNSPLVSVKGE